MNHLNEQSLGERRVLARWRPVLILAFWGAARAAALAQSAVAPAGAGTAADPYQLTQLGNLVWLSDNVSSSANKYYRLMNDIDASSTTNWNDAGTSTDVLEGFKPIGTLIDAVNQQPFSGQFEGSGHRIQNLAIHRPGARFVGLFGNIGPQGQVRNLRLEGVSIQAGGRVGGLAGNNYGMITNCQTSGAISGGELDRIGGLAGQNWTPGMLWNCASACAVAGTSNHVGGLVGVSKGSIINSSASGAVSGNNYVGGLVGNADWGITNSHASGSVSSSGSEAGGLVGIFFGINAVTGATNFSLANCYAVGAVLGQGLAAGGLVGENQGGVIANCFATGPVEGEDYGVGGLVGWNSGLLSGCQAGGSVIGNGASATWGSRAGGLVGENQGAIINCNALGAVQAIDYSVGGLVGFNWTNGTIARCHADGSVVGMAKDSTAGARAGGLVGENRGPVTDCFATGPVEGQNYFVGGLAGYNSAMITRCYSVGLVTGTQLAGGLVGLNSGGAVADCYWNAQSSGQIISSGSDFSYAKSTAEMKQQATFAGWDFSAVWGITENVSYPYLKASPNFFAASLSLLSYSASGYQMRLTGVPGGAYAVQASPDLLVWTWLETNQAPFDFTDTNARAFSQQFYRAVYLP